jgi:hypothetical protein
VRKWLTRIALALVGITALAIAAVLIAQRVSDGPIGPLGGGPLRSGELVTDSSPDWHAILGDGGQVELQLVEPPRSRVTGAMVHDGQLYVPCDLGFFWRRMPDARLRFILHVIWVFKHWHEDALKDGRAVLRIKGKRYERQAVRVTDPELLAALRSQMETAAASFLGQQKLLEIPVDPGAIWFFRMDPRPKAG